MATEASHPATAGAVISPKPLITLVDVLSQLMEQEASRWRTVSANPSLAVSNSTSQDCASDNISELFLIK